MNFIVSFKGFNWYRGKLSDAREFVASKWGSTEEAWRIGVKLTPALNHEARR